MIADQLVVQPAVVMALEADDLRAAGVGAGEAEERMVGLRSATAEAHDLHGRHECANLFRNRYFDFVLSAIRLAQCNLSLYSFDKLRVTMAQNERPVSGNVIDILVAVHVKQSRSLAVAKVERRRAFLQPDIAAHTGSKMLLSALPKLLRAGNPSQC